MSGAYYNEFDPKAAAGLRQLIKDGFIPEGVVDERSIVEVRAEDLRGFKQCHFFAGIGGWAYALRLAGWDDDRPVWTGSAPCQPYSAAGKRTRQQDERHLWPYQDRLIGECRPATFFGEQVASAIGAGWIDDVFDGLEEKGYACASSVLPACAVGAPHRRDRLFFVADAAGTGSQARGSAPLGRSETIEEFERCGVSGMAYSDDQREPQQERIVSEGGRRSQHGSQRNVMADPQRIGMEKSEREIGNEIGQEKKQSGSDIIRGGEPFNVANTEHNGRDGSAISRSYGEDDGRGRSAGRSIGSEQPTRSGAGGNVSGDLMGDALNAGLQGQSWHGDRGDQSRRFASDANRSATPSGFWDDLEWYVGPDGKARPVKSGLCLLVDGFPQRIPLLRAAGNAIVSELAAQFIISYMEARGMI